MKNMCILLVVLGMAFSGFAQSDYKVIKVNGKIVIQKSGKELSTGLVFSEDENLEFKTPSSKAAVINSEKGRMILTAKNTGGANYLPAMSNVSMRKGMVVMNAVDLSNRFKGNMVLLDKIEIPISEEAYPMNEKSFFYIRYKYNNEQINKRLTYEENYLVIDREELLKVDGKPISAPDEDLVQLFYYQDESSMLVSEFSLILPDEEELQAEVQVILEELKEKPNRYQISEVTNYLNSFYGKTDEDDVKLWLYRKFDFK